MISAGPVGSAEILDGSSHLGREQMKDQITINGRDGAFGAYIARPDALPAPAVVVLHEVFGVNACHPTSSPPKPKKEASR